MIDRNGIRRIFAGKAVGLAFAFWLGIWVLWEFAGVFERLSAQLIGLLTPVWLPVYLAILFASGLRNVFLPWVGNGILFYVVIFSFLYVEAVLLAGVYRGLRRVYRRYFRKNTDSIPS